MLDAIAPAFTSATNRRQATTVDQRESSERHHPNKKKLVPDLQGSAENARPCWEAKIAVVFNGRNDRNSNIIRTCLKNIETIDSTNLLFLQFSSREDSTWIVMKIRATQRRKYSVSDMTIVGKMRSYRSIHHLQTGQLVKEDRVKQVGHKTKRTELHTVVLEASWSRSSIPDKRNRWPHSDKRHLHN